MKIALIIIGSVLLFLVIVLFIGLYIIYRFSFYSPMKGQNDVHAQLDGPIFGQYKDTLLPLVEAFQNRPYEDLYIK